MTNNVTTGQLAAGIGDMVLEHIQDKLPIKTLRDEFAIAALQSLLLEPNNTKIDGVLSSMGIVAQAKTSFAEFVARLAYVFADAMMKAREAKGGEE